MLAKRNKQSRGGGIRETNRHEWVRPGRETGLSLGGVTVSGCNKRTKEVTPVP